MRICMESAMYVKDWSNPLEGLMQAKKDGVDYLDMQLFGNTDKYSEFFDCSEDSFAEKMAFIKECAKKAGITFCQAHGPWKYPTVDGTEEGRTERFEKFARSIKGCALLGIKYIAFHPLMPFDEWGTTEPDPKYANDINYEFYTKLCKVAEENDVVICFENMPFKAQYVSPPIPSFEFIKQIDSPYFKMCFDTGHAVMLGSDVGADIRKIGKGVIKILHVHDNDGSADQHICPGRGIIDWDDFCDALNEIEFDGIINLECLPHPEQLTEQEYLDEKAHFIQVAVDLANKLK